MEPVIHLLLPAAAGVSAKQQELDIYLNNQAFNEERGEGRRGGGERTKEDMNR